MIRGIENDPGQSTQVRQWLTEGSLGPLFESSTEPNAVIGSELANRIGVSTGQVFQVIPASESARGQTHRLRVAGIFRSGLFEYDSTWIYVAFDTATALAGNDHAASVMSIQVRDPDNVKQVVANISNALGSAYTIVDWQQANQPLFAALALERRMGLFIIGLIIAIAALNITTMLILVVVERQTRHRDPQRARCNAHRSDVALRDRRRGCRCDRRHCRCRSWTRSVPDWKSLQTRKLARRCLLDQQRPADHTGPLKCCWPRLIAFALSVLATIYPARAASRMRPVEALRDS